jgi:hypothetical protein
LALLNEKLRHDKGKAGEERNGQKNLDQGETLAVSHCAENTPRPHPSNFRGNSWNLKRNGAQGWRIFT